MKDERKINQKAINEIIKYYENVDDTENSEDLTDTASDETPEDAPALVEIIEEKRNTEAPDENTKIIPFPINTAEPKAKTAEIQQEVNAETEEKSDETAATEAEESSEEYAENSETTENDEDAENSEKSENEEIPEEDNEEETEDGESENPDEDDTSNLESLAAFQALGDINLNRKKQNEEFSFTKKQIIIIAITTVVLMVTVFLLVTVDTGFIGSYKHNFMKNATTVLSNLGIDIQSDDTQTDGPIKGVTQYNASLDKSITVPVEKAGESVFTVYNDGLVFANANYMRLIDSDGETVWETNTLIADPIIKSAGHYILLAENGGTKLCLYYDSKLIYTADTDDKIVMCDLSSNGDILAVTDKASFKGGLVVFNKEGNQIFAWSSGSDNIISAHISASSRRIAVSLLNTDSQVKSTVQFFDINEAESYAQVIFEDTILFDLRFVGDTVHAFGDNCIAGLTSGGGILYDKRFDNAEFTHYSMDKNGNKILVFDASNIPLINIYGSGDALRHQLSSDEIPDFADIYENYIVFNSGRDILYGRIGGKQMATFTASMDIRELMLMNKNTVAVVYSNSIELVRM